VARAPWSRPFWGRRGKRLDELGRGCEERLEAVLAGAVGDGDGEVGLSAAGLAVKDERAAFADEVWTEVRTDEGGSQARLEREVVERLEVRESGAAREALSVRYSRAVSPRSRICWRLS